MSFAQKHSLQNQQNNTTTRNNKMFKKCKKYFLSNVFSFLVKGSWKHELHMLNSMEALLESVMSNKNLGTNHQPSTIHACSPTFSRSFLYLKTGKKTYRRNDVIFLLGSTPTFCGKLAYLLVLRQN